jgi:hypothetical protein
MRRKRPELWSMIGFFTMTMLQLTRCSLAQKSMTEMEHPPCSPDLAPNDFWPFPKVKSAFKGLIFQDNDDIKQT